jgi:hypothetical protein
MKSKVDWWAMLGLVAIVVSGAIVVAGIMAALYLCAHGVRT